MNPDWTNQKTNRAYWSANYLLNNLDDNMYNMIARYIYAGQTGLVVVLSSFQNFINH